MSGNGIKKNYLSIIPYIHYSYYSKYTFAALISDPKLQVLHAKQKIK